MSTITITQEITDRACLAAQEMLADKTREKMFTNNLPFELWVARNTDNIIALSEITVANTRFYIGFKPQ